jgi:hypothetical protein
MTKTIAGTDWEFIFSMEAPQYYPELRVDPKAHLRNKYFATTSFKSEIPLPFFSFADYDLQARRPVSYDKAIKGAVFMERERNCISANHREDIVRALIQSPLIRIESVSKCLHNAKKPKDDNKDEIIRNYMFYLAFENRSEDDYVTEKLWGSLSAGVVPVYLGGDNIESHVPPHSIINVKDFNSTSSLAAYLGQVASNRTLYESYHLWRTQQLPQSFLRKYGFTRTHSMCRMCRWAFAKQYGLGWNHEEQAIEEPAISRKICFQSGRQMLVTYPFRESWASSNHHWGVGSSDDSKNNEDTCYQESWETSPKSAVLLRSGTLRRKIVIRDGIIDLFLLEPASLDAGCSDDAVLYLDTPIQVKADDDGLHVVNKNQYWLQDETSRITILTNRPDITVQVTTKQQSAEREAALQILIPKGQMPIRLRFITEDNNHFYENGKKEAQYFATIMADDFENPIEAFLVPKRSSMSGRAQGG